MISFDELRRFGGGKEESEASEQQAVGFDLRRFIAQHGFKVLREKLWNSHPGGTIFELEQCPFDANHIKGSASFTEFKGVPGFKCQHDGCLDKGIKEVFAKYPVTFRAKPAGATEAQALIRLVEDAEWLRTPAGDPYGRYKVGTHFEVAALNSKGFSLWLRKRFYDTYGKPPAPQALGDAIHIFTAKALFDGQETEVAVRIAEYGAQVYIDLCNEDWEVVEISAEGWRITPDPPVRFRRTKGMLALPKPQTGGSLLALRELINIGEDDNWMLLLGWLAAACRATGPYPILVLQGEQGSAKSTLERIVRRIIDPSSAPVRTPPRTDRDLLITARNSWMIAYDNLSDIPQWFSDSLCRLATGGGLSIRELYTDSEEVLFNAMRPIVLNGIDHLAERPDLADRGLLLHLPRITEERRRTQREIDGAVERELPQILGALYSAVSLGLAHLNRTSVAGMPRMADFAVWVTAAAPALGFSASDFIRAYQANRVDAIQETLEGDAVAVAIVVFMEQLSEESWRGSCKELKVLLESYVDDSIRKSNTWPNSPRALSGRLRRLVTFLGASGIDIIFPPKGTKAAQGKRLLTLAKVSPQIIATTATSASTFEEGLHLESDAEEANGVGPGDQRAEERELSTEQSPDSAGLSSSKPQQGVIAAVGGTMTLDCPASPGAKTIGTDWEAFEL